MADQIQCTICDFTVQTAQTDSESIIGLLGGAPHVSLDAETQLVEHLESHTVLDWVKAFKMADAYIAQLEAELDTERATVAGLRTDLSRAMTFETNTQLARAEPQRYAVQAPTGAFEGGDGLLAPNGRPLTDYLTPAEIARKKAQAAARARVQAADPNESLIPFMSPASRPEGVVGRKI